jgi:hypothetical protein
VETGLRAWIEGHDAHVQAAVWLLLAHGVWLRRGDFLREAVVRSADGQYWIAFAPARAAFDRGLFAQASMTELAVLDLAIMLGTDRFALRAMGPDNARLVTTAVTHAVRSGGVW